MFSILDDYAAGTSASMMCVWNEHDYQVIKVHSFSMTKDALDAYLTRAERTDLSVQVSAQHQEN